MLITEKSACTGCELCLSVCPGNAIHMQADEEGFRFPVVDDNLCTKCQLCQKKCPANHPGGHITDTHALKAFSGFYKDENMLKKSASGGIASALAEKVLAEGGRVFGVAYSHDFKHAEYIEADSLDKINLLKGSKYIQARKGNLYKKIESSVKEDRPTFFIGLPCEVAAVKAFLGGDRENLLTCDLICHGPTSEKVSEQYISRLEKSYKSKLKFFSVRYKEKGWEPMYVKAKFENGKVFLKPFFETEYGIAFRRMSRPSCANCSFKGGNRASDLTIGDFWGLAPADKGYNANGVSVMIVNTPKGEELLRDIPGFSMEETDVEAAISGNPFFNASKNLKGVRGAFSKGFANKGLFSACKKYRYKERMERIPLFAGLVPFAKKVMRKR